MDCGWTMKLFDEMIILILEQLNQLAAAEQARLEPSAEAWTDVGEHHMILARETAYELGGNNMPGLSGCLCTARPLLLPEGIYLYGEDLTQITANRPYARLVLAELGVSDDEALYRKFREIDYVRYHIHPEGYMARISPVSQREPVRVGKKALEKHISFRDVGQMYMERYHNISGIKNVNVIFITHTNFDYRVLEQTLGRSEQMILSLNHIFTGLSMDCETCSLKAVCDEVEELRALHFGQKNNVH